MQEPLLDVPPTTAAQGAAVPARQTSKGIACGDIVLIDKKGRRFHAKVTALEQAQSGRFDLEVAPIERGITWRSCSVREVVEVYRKVRRPN